MMHRLLRFEAVRATTVGALLIVGLWTVSDASAQSLGTFRWQLEPYCNVVTLAVTQNGGVFRLEGTDDQCRAGESASAIGTAFPNPDGTIGIGLTIVSAPSAAPVHVDATLSLSDLNGTWRDSVGNAGSFVSTPGAGVAGSPRPTTVAPIGAGAVDPTQIQLRVSGTCPQAQSMQAVKQDGSVECAPVGLGTITRVIAGAGLTGGGTAGDVTIGLATNSAGAFDLSNPYGFVASAPLTATGSPFVSGPGKRLLWDSGRAAFRAGAVTGAQWDGFNTGAYSVAMGENTLASGPHSVALGSGTLASGDASVAIGLFTRASGTGSVALGFLTEASGVGAMAAGELSFAGGRTSVALGRRARAVHDGSFVFADQSATASFSSIGPNQFRVRAAGGVGFYTHPGLQVGVELHPGSGSWSNVSDVNVKENFRDLDGESVLDKLARLPVRTWSYKAQAPTIRHVGPTAQDFKAAFGLGETERQISSIDADGIALAAAKALEARTRTLTEENESLARENKALRERLERIEQALRRR